MTKILYRTAGGLFVAGIIFSIANFVFAQTGGNATTTNSSQLPVTALCGVSVAPVSNSSDYQIVWNAAVFNMYATSSQYEWTGTDSFSGTGSQLSKRYNTIGQKNANVVMRGDRPLVSLDCSVNLINPNQPNSPVPALGGSCQPLISGMQVTWSATVSGGPFGTSATFNWTGTDGLSGTTTQVIKTYSREGKKNATVNIRAGSQSLDLTCQALIASTTPLSNCFIATAAYGSAMEPDVMILRNFRDETLLKSSSGREFVETYYKVSPPIADFIRQHDSLRAMVRLGLEPLIFGLKKSGY